MKKLNQLAIASCCALLVGCAATAPLTSASFDAEGKTFTPEPGKASIYVNRDGRLTGSFVTFQAILDGRITGLLAPNTFQLLSVVPGQHVLSAVGAMRTVEMPRVDAEAGKNYYFNFFAEMGMLQPTMRFTPMSEDEGRKAVTKSKRAETMTY